MATRGGGGQFSKYVHVPYVRNFQHLLLKPVVRIEIDLAEMGTSCTLQK